MALLRYEESFRTEDEFRQLADMYDKLGANDARRWRYHEVLHYDAIDDWNPGDATVVPPPLDHPLWRELMRGNFIDVVFDCPHELQELVSSPSIYDQLCGLDENRKEILYYLAIRLWSPQRLAAYRGQTDRNIRKVYNAAMSDIRSKLYMRLSPHYNVGLPLTFSQREFCKNYNASLADRKEFFNIYEKAAKVTDFTDINEYNDDVLDDTPNNVFGEDNDNEFGEFSFLKTEPDEMYYDTFHFDDDEGIE
jgi:hypothetical protein